MQISSSSSSSGGRESSSATIVGPPATGGWCWRLRRFLRRNILCVTTLLAVVGLLTVFLTVHVERNRGDNTISASASKGVPSRRLASAEEEDCGGEDIAEFFDREKISECEGYWRPLQVPPLRKKGRKDGIDELPWPAPNSKPYCGQAEWLRKLNWIEKKATQSASERFTVVQYRGLSTSRLDRTMLGNKEFVDLDYVPTDSSGNTGGTERETTRICWTGDLGEHYIGKYNVRPSREFFVYVNAKYRQLNGDAEAV